MSADGWPLIVNAHVESGVLKMGSVNTKRIAAFLKKRRDCEVVITIERRHATRSVVQNAWYWSGVLGTLSTHTGYTVDEMHELMKAKFLPKKLALVDGNGVIQDDFIIGGSTTKLNKIEFGDYIEAIRQWAAETLDVNIPGPRPVGGDL
jgi:hypothetical protein